MQEVFGASLLNVGQQKGDHLGLAQLLQDVSLSLVQLQLGFFVFQVAELTILSLVASAIEKADAKASTDLRMPTASLGALPKLHWPLVIHAGTLQQSIYVRIGAERPLMTSLRREAGRSNFAVNRAKLLHVQKGVTALQSHGCGRSKFFAVEQDTYRS